MEGSEHDPHSKATHVMYDKPSALLARYRGLEGVGQELDRILEAVVAVVAVPGGMPMGGPGGRPGEMGKSSR